MTYAPDDAAHDERLATIEELMAARPELSNRSRGFALRRRGRHRAAAYRWKRRLASRA